MSYTALDSIQWGGTPKIGVSFGYDSRRAGGDMQYRIYVTVAPLTGAAYFGYPITPQNEVMHYWTRLAPKRGKKFLQTEAEISAGFTTLGGVMSGRKAFTATAGPGNVLMQESATMAEMMRLPVVYIIQQRGGPSTATVIYS